MSDLELRIDKARLDSSEMENLLSDYLPFVKKQLSGTKNFPLDYDDMLSLGMLTFVNCVRQYTAEKGNFLSFCSVCIKNRLIDESRKQNRYYARIQPLFPEEPATDQSLPETAASLAVYDKEQERNVLCQEIEILSDELSSFDIQFADLPRICPKQDRSRKQCLLLAMETVKNPDFRSLLQRQRRLAQTELSAIFGISGKTIEKHRKYIVTLAILLLGDYPGIRAFLPQYGEVGQE